MPRVARKMLRRGMVGIEAAIVLIAFVIVAAALAFVVLNMGFVTTQKSSAVIKSGLGEASTALEVDGSVLAYSEKSTYVNYTVIPIKVSPGRHFVDLYPTRASVVYWSTTAGSFADIYVAYGYVYKNTTDNNYYLAVYNTNDQPIVTIGSPGAKIGTAINLTKIWEILNTNIDDEVYAAIIWINSKQTYSEKDTNLELGEKTVVLIGFKSPSVQPTAYQTIKIEIKPPEGATLTVERTMPPGIAEGVIDLG